MLDAETNYTNESGRVRCSQLAGGRSAGPAFGSRVGMAALVGAPDTVVSRGRKWKKRRVTIDRSIETPKLKENTKKTSSAPCAAVSWSLVPVRCCQPRLSKSGDALRVGQKNLRHVPPALPARPKTPQATAQPRLNTLSRLVRQPQREGTRKVRLAAKRIRTSIGRNKG